MGYAFMIADCLVCKRAFSFNPNLVPSHRVNGVKEPVCRDCIEAANPVRKKKGLAPLTYAPGAYEPVDEAELG
jgi:hypothetical protein